MRFQPKKPLSKEEHFSLAKDLRNAQECLEKWSERFYNAYSVNGKEVKELHKVLHLLSCTICDTQDNHFYLNVENEKTPYYGDGKIAWG